MFTPRIYNCRTPENVIKGTLFVVGFALSLAIHDWATTYFHKRGPVPPLVYGQSLPKAMVYAAAAMFGVLLVRYGGPSIIQFFRLRIEVQEDGLRYVLPDWSLSQRGFARWDGMKAQPENAKGLTLLVRPRELLIPRYVSGYSELVQEIQRHCPTSPVRCLLDEKLDTDPALLSEVHAAITAGHKQAAVELLVTRAGMDPSISRFYVNDWAQENDPEGVMKPQPKKGIVRGPVGFLFAYIAVVIVYLFVHGP